jgi:hypothetical protein
MYTPRFNPNSAVSNWKGRLDYLKGYPGKAMSGALNGGFFGGGVSASGGTEYEYGIYKAHVFTSSGTFTITSNPNAQKFELLIVAGGGGPGAVSNGGGGGAGGMRTWLNGGGGTNNDALTLADGAYSVTIGAGGAYSANNGNVSEFLVDTSTTPDSYRATYGGRGGTGWSTGSHAGGSGGGGAGDNTSANYGGTGNWTEGNSPSYSPVEGYNGAGGNQIWNGNASGGGGAAGAGTLHDGSGIGGNGGLARATTITTDGTSMYFAGGGGGGAYNNSGSYTVGGHSGFYRQDTGLLASRGGMGAGASGSTSNTDYTAAAANWGGGGGGSNASYAGGNGGSGIVIVRYATDGSF